MGKNAHRFMLLLQDWDVFSTSAAPEVVEHSTRSVDILPVERSGNDTDDVYQAGVIVDYEQTVISLRQHPQNAMSRPLTSLLIVHRTCSFEIGSTSRS